MTTKVTPGNTITLGLNPNDYTFKAGGYFQLTTTMPGWNARITLEEDLWYVVPRVCAHWIKQIAGNRKKRRGSHHQQVEENCFRVLTDKHPLFYEVFDDDRLPDRSWSLECEHDGFRVALSARLHVDRDLQNSITHADVEVHRYDNRNKIDLTSMTSESSKAEDLLTESFDWFQSARQSISPTFGSKPKPFDRELSRPRWKHGQMR